MGPVIPKFVFPENHFDGTFYLLTSAAAYSSARLTAQAVKCNQQDTKIPFDMKATSGGNAPVNDYLKRKTFKKQR